MVHIKRYIIPKFWPLKKKGFKFAPRVMPGPHPKDFSIPLLVIIRDVLKYAETTKEVKAVLNAGKVLIDKKVRKEPSFPVGLMDVLEIPDVGKYWRVVVDENGLLLKEINKDESYMKLCKITGKQTLKGGKIQINLHDGRNIIVDSNSYKPGDSLLIHLPDQKILEHFAFQEGQEALIIGGKNIGEKGEIKKIRKRKHMLEKHVVYIDVGGKDIKTIKEYVMVGKIERSKVKGSGGKKG